MRLAPLDIGSHAVARKPGLVERVEAQQSAQSARFEIRIRYGGIANRDLRLAPAAECAQPEFAEITDLGAGIDTADRLGDAQPRHYLAVGKHVEIRLVDIQVRRHEEP